MKTLKSQKAIGPFRDPVYRITGTVFPTLILLLLVAGCVPNHYLGYKDGLQQQPNGAIIKLQDQFRTTKAKVLEPAHFYNPVQKTKRTGPNEKPTVTKIRYKDHHLMGFEIKTDTMLPRIVFVKNQFSSTWQNLRVKQAKYLLVPTQKINPKQHKPPKHLDHYLCYEVKGEKVDVRVALKDQFRGYDYMPTGEPCLLCNPVRKTHNGQIVPIQNKKWHLVAYKLDYQIPETIPATGKNQFGTVSMRLNQLDWILVPSLKRLVYTGSGDAQ